MRKAAGFAAGGVLLCATLSLRATTISLGNVIAMGDSITEGKLAKDVGPGLPGLAGGYRGYLQNDLTALGYSYYFVGQEDSGLPNTNTGYSGTVANGNLMADPNHEGYGSITINEMINGINNLEGFNCPGINQILINDATTPYQPPNDPNQTAANVILLMIGTNDALAGTSGSTTASYLSNLVSDIVTDDPTVKLFVSNALPVDPNGGYTTAGTLTNLQSYDALIPSVIAPFSTSSHPVYFVDNYSTVNPVSQTSDGVHPTYIGYQQIAQSWTQTIDEVNRGLTTITNTSTVTFPAGTPWTYGQIFVNSFNATPGGNINASSATFLGDSGSNFPNLYVSVDAGTVYFKSNQHLAALTIGYGGTVQVTPTPAGSHSLLQIWQNGYFIDNGTLDLTNNSLDVESGNLATITSLIQQGYNGVQARFNISGGGYWNGTGIISSTAASDISHLTALGVLLNSTPNGATLYGATAPLGLFDGTSPASTDVLVKFTYYGDTNLDGVVDGTDYARIDNGYLSHGSLTGWYNGDFNYDGVVDGSDYTLIDNAFNMQGAAINDLVATTTSQIALVPEPASTGLLAAGVAITLSRRRRRIRLD